MSLPLPLVPFEEYMLADDRPAFPMNFFFRFRFQGALVPDRLESALQQALDRHPLLTAVVNQDRHGRWQWVAAMETGTRVDYLNEPQQTPFPVSTPLDLRQTPGLQARVITTQQGSDLILQFHHCCCDGAGALQLVEDLLIGYANLSGTSSTNLPYRPLDPERLKQRATFGLTQWDLLKMTPKQMVGLLGVRKFFTRFPQPVVPHQVEMSQATLPADYPSCVVHVLPEAKTQQLLQAAKQLGVTANDLLLRDLFCALSQWRSQHAWGHRNQWLRISVPINLRMIDDIGTPAANIVSMVFFDRRGRDCDDPAELLRGIQQEMNRIKRCHLGLTLPRSLKLLRLLPGGLKNVTQARRCAVSGLITNLGSVLSHSPLPLSDGKRVVGDVTLQSVDASPPNRPFQPVSFLALTYAGSLSICQQFDSRVVDEQKAAELNKLYAATIQQSIASTEE